MGELIPAHLHDPVVQDPAGLRVRQVSVLDGAADALGCSLEGSSCAAQPIRTDVLQLAGLRGPNRQSVSR